MLAAFFKRSVASLANVLNFFLKKDRDIAKSAVLLEEYTKYWSYLASRIPGDSTERICCLQS